MSKKLYTFAPAFQLENTMQRYKKNLKHEKS